MLPLGDLRNKGAPGWSTGHQAKHLQFAFAWGDGKVRHWHMHRRQDGMNTQTDARDNHTIAYLAAHDQVLTGGRGNPNPYLQLWRPNWKLM